MNQTNRSCKINYVSDEDLMWHWLLIFYALFGVRAGYSFQTPNTYSFIDANRKWDLWHRKKGTTKNVLCSWELGQCYCQCTMELRSSIFARMHIYYWNRARCLSPSFFDDFCIIGKNKRQSCYAMAFIWLIVYFSSTEIYRCNTACQLCWYLFPSHWDYCQDT